ncbi:peptidoglycan-binding protein [Methylovirgula sp. 4M-Z18]|nr:peptidoglycan-binding protein [Methylovirgula sp. 4M-Z18]
MGRNLSLGMSGEDVAAVQRLLNYHLPLPLYTPLKPDGQFGPLTLARVKEFQSLNEDYLVKMPITPGGGVEKKPLAIDGIVGPNTGRVLLDLRTVTLSPDSKLIPRTYEGSQAIRGNRPVFNLLQNVADRGNRPTFNLFQNVADTPDDPGPPPPLPAKTIRFLTLQAGSQAQINPWAVSPLVLTGQYSLLARNAGRPDFLLTAGGQFSQNLGTVNGDWSAQAFGQMGLGNLGVSLGPVDFVNPFVQAMLTFNHGQSPTAGLALGNQTNLSLSDVVINGIKQPRLAVFFNLQAVANVDLNTGLGAAPSVQGLLGLSWTFAPF